MTSAANGATGHDGQAPTLPEPRRPRWQPLRGGLVDLFHYDAEEFWFRDGNLLLRGNNGTGKSKVLALLLPYLLDGDHRPQRVEPDGDPNKRMDWNLLLGGRYTDRLGYAWLEFGRRADDGTVATVTLGCGMKAVTGRGIAAKWFFVTDRRVGHDLALVDGARLVLSRDRLREALGDRGELFDRVESYRRAVDERLFHLGPERYDALVTLLIQLRQPQLSKRPNAQALSDALTRALPPLADAVVSDVADAFHALDDDRRELTGLAEARGAVDAFRRRYRRYAAIATRRRAAAVRLAQSAYETANRRLSDADAQLDDAERRERALGDELARLRRERHRAQVERETLSADPRMRDAGRLRDAADAAERAAAVAERAHSDVTEAQTTAQRRRAERDRCTAEAAQSDERFRGTRRRAAELAGTAGLRATHAALVDPVGLDDDPAAPVPESEAMALADRRDEAVAHVRGLVATAAAAERDRAEARRALDDAGRQRDAIDEALRGARAEAGQAADDLLAAFERYATTTDELVLDDLDAVHGELAAWVASQTGDNPATIAVQHAARRVERDHAAEETRLTARHDAIEAEADQLDVERERLRAGGELPPPAPHTRLDGVRDDRPGAPLWRLIDFVDDISDDDRAGLEAALEAGGLLDAWVTPDGALLSADTDDVVVTAGAPVASSLAAVIRPTAHDAVPEATVAAVLAGIGLGAATADTWVSADGRFRVGALEGAWHKPAVEHVGPAARDQARRRRLDELDELDRGVQSRRGELARQRARLAERRTTLDAEVAALPGDEHVRETAASVTSVTAELARADEHVAVVERRLTSVIATLDQAVSSRDEAAADLGLPGDATGLDAVAAAVAGYRLALAALWPAVRAARTARAAHRHAVDELTNADAAVERRTVAHEAAVRDADAAAQIHDTLQQTHGAAAREVIAQLEAVTQRLRELDDDVERCDGELRDAVGRAGVARGRVGELRDRVDEQAQLRRSSTEGLRRFAATGLLAAALGDDATVDVPDPATPWAPDPTVRLARRLDQALADVDADDAAWDRAANTLIEQLTDLQRTLSVHGHEAVADQHDEVWVVTVQFRSTTVSPDELAAHLTDDITHRERLLDAREREVLEEHLVAEAASQLTALIADAERRVERMNAELAARPTSTGMTLRLRWTPAADAPAGLAEARDRLLRQVVDAWSSEDRRAISDFLKAQIDAVRAADEAGTWRDHLAAALDYRRWHRFVIERRVDGAWRHATGPASGGERVLAVTVPLFAAASSHYESAHPDAPRLVLLDEAFAGVDDDSRAKCLGLLASFDLDYMMTSEREWGCYPTVPGLAICHLTRRDGIDAVHVSRWEWDGLRLDEAAHPTRTALAAVGGDGAAAGSGNGTPGLFGPDA